MRGHQHVPISLCRRNSRRRSNYANTQLIPGVVNNPIGRYRWHRQPSVRQVHNGEKENWHWGHRYIGHIRHTLDGGLFIPCCGSPPLIAKCIHRKGGTPFRYSALIIHQRRLFPAPDSHSKATDSLYHRTRHQNIMNTLRPILTASFLAITPCVLAQDYDSSTPRIRHTQAAPDYDSSAPKLQPAPMPPPRVNDHTVNAAQLEQLSELKYRNELRSLRIEVDVLSAKVQAIEEELRRRAQKTR